MAEVTGAQAMFEFMAREGVRYVFGNPGTTELPLMDQFAARDEIKYILSVSRRDMQKPAASPRSSTCIPIRAWPTPLAISITFIARGRR
jgi:Thiamine pyrophosphate enzyme, N-terminal TPP binding domain